MKIITTHKGTDFDAFASVVAATILYPDAVPVIPRSINPNVRAFLSIHKDIFVTNRVDEIDLQAVEGLVVVDANRWNRLDGLEKISKNDDIEIIVWDHHLDGGNIKSDWECIEDTGAAITLLVRQLKKEKKFLTPIQATLFLMGLYEDTGSLSFPSTKAEDARAAAYLLEQNADLNIVSSFLHQAYGVKQKKILFDMLRSESRVILNGFHVGFGKLFIDGHVASLSIVVRMYREILNVDAAFGIFSNKERSKCIVIGRSNIDDIHMGTIMRSLGGGGHPRAGSALLRSVNPNTVETMIMELIKGNQETSVQISDLMSFPVTTVPQHISMEEAAALLRQKGCTGFPVVDDYKIVGILSRRDFHKIKKPSQFKFPVKAFMSTDVITVSPEKSPMYAARLMVKYDIGRLPVVDKGDVIGIVTRSDAMMYFYDILPD